MICSALLQPRVDIAIRYIEVDFTFGLPDYVRVIEKFVISRFYSIHFTVLWPDRYSEDFVK